MNITIKNIIFNNRYDAEQILFKYLQINNNVENINNIIIYFKIETYPSFIFKVILTKDKYQFFLEFLDLIYTQTDFDLLEMRLYKDKIKKYKTRFNITENTIKKLKLLIRNINISQDYIIKTEDSKKLKNLLNTHIIQNKRILFNYLYIQIFQTYITIETPFWMYIIIINDMPEFMQKLFLYKNGLEKLINKKIKQQLQIL